jgi:hypothetical protein
MHDIALSAIASRRALQSPRCKGYLAAPPAHLFAAAAGARPLPTARTQAESPAAWTAPRGDGPAPGAPTAAARRRARPRRLGAARRASGGGRARRRRAVCMWSRWRAGAAKPDRHNFSAPKPRPTQRTSASAAPPLPPPPDAAPGCRRWAAACAALRSRLAAGLTTATASSVPATSKAPREATISACVGAVDGAPFSAAGVNAPGVPVKRGLQAACERSARRSRVTRPLEPYHAFLPSP